MAPGGVEDASKPIFLVVMEEFLISKSELAVSQFLAWDIGKSNVGSIATSRDVSKVGNAQFQAWKQLFPRSGFGKFSCDKP